MQKESASLFIKNNEVLEYNHFINHYMDKPLYELYEHRDNIREIIKESVKEYLKNGQTEDLFSFWREEFVLDFFIRGISRKEPDFRC